MSELAFTTHEKTKIGKNARNEQSFVVVRTSRQCRDQPILNGKFFQLQSLSRKWRFSVKGIYEVCRGAVHTLQSLRTSEISNDV